MQAGIEADPRTGWGNPRSGHSRRARADHAYQPRRPHRFKIVAVGLGAGPRPGPIRRDADRDRCAAGTLAGLSGNAFLFGTAVFALHNVIHKMVRAPSSHSRVKVGIAHEVEPVVVDRGDGKGAPRSRWKIAHDIPSWPKNSSAVRRGPQKKRRRKRSAWGDATVPSEGAMVGRILALARHEVAEMLRCGNAPLPTPRTRR